MNSPVSPDCVFCAIVAGRVPATIVYEDEETVAFLDIHPSARGHTLVIPRAHYENVFELPPDAGRAVMQTLTRVARGLRAALDPEGMNVMQANGRAAGQTVFHVHFHLMPRWAGDRLPVPRHPVETASQAQLQELAAMIRPHVEQHEPG